jgi:large subunit ribosomal protein L3
MTQIFADDGTRVPVTVLHVAGNVVTAHRTVERDGYAALQVGFEREEGVAGHQARARRSSRRPASPRATRSASSASPPTSSASSRSAPPVTAAIFEVGTQVDVSGTSKGKGYQGVIKRHNMEGEKNSHGQHEFFRHGGSIGCRKTPGRVHRGKRMTGHMGNERVTTQNMTVAQGRRRDRPRAGPRPGPRRQERLRDDPPRDQAGDPRRQDTPA